MRHLVLLVVLTALFVVGCGGSSRKGPPALVFVSTRDGDYALFGARSDGSHARRLSKEKGDPSSPAGLFFQIEPAWSADGTQIAFVSGRDGHGHLYVMNPDGSGTRRLTDTTQDDSHPSWSPDGKWIVFSREGVLFRVPAAGGPATRVLRNAPGHAADPSYSPDGRWIAYDYRLPGYSIREIYVVHADGTGKPRKITNLGWASGYPAWSPTGRVLAFQSNVAEDHQRNEIFSVPFVGARGPTRLTTSAADAIQPAWSPDGALSFSRDGAIWRWAPDGETKLTSGKDNDSAPAWNPEPPQ